MGAPFLARSLREKWGFFKSRNGPKRRLESRPQIREAAVREKAQLPPGTFPQLYFSQCSLNLYREISIQQNRFMKLASKSNNTDSGTLKSRFGNPQLLFSQDFARN